MVGQALQIRRVVVHAHLLDIVCERSPVLVPPFASFVCLLVGLFHFYVYFLQFRWLIALIVGLFAYVLFWLLIAGLVGRRVS